MNIDFNNYEYDGAWFGNETVNFNGKDFYVDVQIDDYDDVMVPECSQKALLNFLDNLNGYLPKIKEAVFEYYCELRAELGYDVEVDDDYPEVSSSDEILNMITLVGITVPDQDDYDDEAVSLVFDCTWDAENGLGICFIGDDIDEIGFQDVAL